MGTDLRLDDTASPRDCDIAFRCGALAATPCTARVRYALIRAAARRLLKERATVTACSLLKLFEFYAYKNRRDSPNRTRPNISPSAVKRDTLGSAKKMLCHGEPKYACRLNSPLPVVNEPHRWPCPRTASESQFSRDVLQMPAGFPVVIS